MTSWTDAIGEEKQKPYFQALMARVKAEREQGVRIYPEEKHVFAALRLTPLDKVKVVILGQDPYHGAGQAHGLCFSVPKGVKIPPSLANIYKALAQDISGFTIPRHGNLEYWAQQGVLLLNTVLTVQEGQAHSHAQWGWETFTDAVIEAVNQHCHGVSFLLWGSHAQKKGQHISTDKHLILTSVHPSPLSAHRGFFGCQHFSKTNNYLLEQGKSSIHWQL